MNRELSSSPSLQKPQEFGRYLIIGKLGSGGMGKVYLAIERDYDRKVAIKISDAADSLRDEDIRRFEAEARTMKELNHQNIIQVFSYGVVGERQYISMRLIEGPTLREKMKSRGRLDLPTIVDYAKQIARGLLYAHRKGVIHRDIKPSNILIDEEERLVISDFGISTSQSTDHLTLPGMAMGTPEYMSPEQCQGFTITPRSDIYSFGIILYELLTGKPPFSANTPVATAYKQVNEEPVPVASIRKDTPPQLAAIVETCIAKNPDARFASMEQVLDALDAVEIETITQARRKIAKADRRTAVLPTSRREKKKSGVMLLRAVSILVIAALFFFAGRLFSLREAVQPSGMHLLENELFLDHQRVLSLEDGDERSWEAIPQDSEGRLYTITAKFPANRLIYTLAITLIPNDAQTADQLRRTRHPTAIRIENERGQVRHLQLPIGLPGPHYISIDPISAKTVQLRIVKSSGDEREPVVLCDLGFIGIALPDP